MKVIKLKRIFKYGTLELPDPNPQLDENEILKMFAPHYPEFTNACIDGPEIEGDKQVFTISRSVGTKG